MTDIKYFLISDISGSPVLGLNSGFTTTYLNDGVAISGSSATVSEISDGFYKIEVAPVPEGELFLRLEHSSPSNYIAPDFHEWTKDSTYTIDDVYGRLIIATSATALPVVPSQRFTTTTINSKEGDDITEIVQVPARYRPLTDWTNITIQAYPAGRLLDMMIPPITGTYDADVLNETDGTVEILIGKDVTSGQIPSGVPTAVIYADLQGNDSFGYRKTLVEFAITLKRDFNTNNP
jgi:hypothetical protein